MMEIKFGEQSDCHVEFCYREECGEPFFQGNFLETCRFVLPDQTQVLKVGLGSRLLERNQVKEVYAAASAFMKRCGMKEFSCDGAKLRTAFGEETLRDMAEGLILGSYETQRFPAKTVYQGCAVLTGLQGDDRETAVLEEMQTLMESVIRVRDLVNRPANMLRPEDFAAEIEEWMNPLPVAVQIFHHRQLAEMGLNSLLSVGESSSFPPCLLVLRYHPVEGGRVMGLIGKGVTCDTGGYCIKPADSMGGIKGDMAGGAAVAGAVHALAACNVQQNITAVIPLCENRISPGSAIPGDVIEAYGGITVEIRNTDAEGRLILADAISYAVLDEHVDKVLDIATLTGAAAAAFGNGVTAAMCEDEDCYRDLQEASGISGERFHRLDWHREHEDMIKSQFADIKNSGGNHSRSITAGLFLRRFTKGKPWIHLDIAGTASVDPPLFAYQEKGATGVGVTTLYYLCKKD